MASAPASHIPASTVDQGKGVGASGWGAAGEGASGTAETGRPPGPPWVAGVGFGPGTWTGTVWRGGSGPSSSWVSVRGGMASGTMERGLSRDTGIRSRANTTSHSSDSTRLGALRRKASRSAATTAAA